MADLRQWTQPEADRARGREVIAALVRLGSVDQPDGQPGDQDAVVVAIHLLRPAITRRARRCSPDSDETMRMLISELALVIQTFPWRTSTPTPGRLVLDAWHQAWYGQASSDARFRQHVATTDDTERLLGSATPDTPACVELVDVLTCAAADGILTDDDVRLLWLVVHHGGIGIPGQGATAAVAKVLSVSARTVRRRYRRAVDMLTASYRKSR